MRRHPPVHPRSTALPSPSPPSSAAPPSPLHAALFDLDGTLVDSLGDLALATDEMLRDLAMPAAGAVRVRGWVGRGIDRLVAEALAWARREHGLGARATTEARARERFHHHYALANGVTTRPCAGADALLATLRERGVKLALVTNKSREFTRPLLAQMGWKEYFDCLVCADEAGAKKPDPAPVRLALERLGVTAGEAIMVGDSDYDLLAARGAGVWVARVGGGYGPVAAMGAAVADCEVDCLDTLRRRLTP